MWPDLRADVELDLAALRQELEETEQHRRDMLARPADSPPSGWDTRAAGALLQQCYTGMENALKRLARVVDGSVPDGPASHADLLTQMAAPSPRRRAVISSDLLPILREFMGFRHVARGHYGHAYDWDRLGPLLAKLPAAADQFARELRAFLDQAEAR